MKKNVKIDKETHKKLNIFCAIHGLAISEAAEEIIKIWLDSMSDEQQKTLIERVKSKIRVKCENLKRRASDQ